MLLSKKRQTNTKRNGIRVRVNNKWSITAGHVKSVEDVEDAMIREIKEEVGINCKKEDLDLILIAKHSSYRGDNNNFRYGYFCRTNKKITDFTIQKEEVSELKYITLQELEQIVEKQEKSYLFPKWKYVQEVITYLKNKI